MVQRARYYQINRPAIDALKAVDAHLESVHEKLRSLLEMRVSQINGCAYCMDVHAEQARKRGETQQRLDCLPAWRESGLFDDAEMAALEWAEVLTHVSTTHAPDDAYAALMLYYSEQQIVDLTLIISLMNTWNRLAIGHRTLPHQRS